MPRGPMLSDAELRSPSQLYGLTAAGDSRQPERAASPVHLPGPGHLGSARVADWKEAAGALTSQELAEGSGEGGK